MLAYYRFALSFILFTVVVASSSAEEAKKEDPNKLTFTDKIKTIRSVSGEYDVIFVDHFGPYSVPFSLPNSKAKDLSPEDQLREAFKQNLSITVTVNPITDTLISIDSEAARSPSSVNKDTSQDQDLPPELKDYEDLFKKHLGH